jgi:hypothetical protein
MCQKQQLISASQKTTACSVVGSIGSVFGGNDFQ